ncbi:hypothetical protein [Protofrankia coriariae]|uniref:hypothetical protein n=1 Tax=Protofrankia coriariae TaxID=1562887 RepID=UPI00069BEC1F
MGEAVVGMPVGMPVDTVVGRGIHVSGRTGPVNAASGVDGTSRAGPTGPVAAANCVNSPANFANDGPVAVAVAVACVGACRGDGTGTVGSVGVPAAARGAGEENGGHDVGQPVTGCPGELLDRCRVSPGQHQLAEPVPQAAAFAGCLGLLLGVALCAGGGDPVDVGEHGFGQRHQPVGVQPAALRGLGEPPPGDPGADPVGAEKGVQRASGAELAASQPDVDLTAGREIGRSAGVGADHGEETQQRLFDSLPDAAAERALQRARVRRHLTRDGRDQIIAEGRQLKPQDVGKIGRQIGRQLSVWNSFHGLHPASDGPRVVEVLR